MRAVVGAVLSLVLVSGNAMAGEPQAAGADKTVEAFHAAMEAGDAAAVTALLHPDVSVYESGHVERSRAEYESNHLPHDIAFAKATTRDVRTLSTFWSDENGWSVSEVRITGTYKDKPVDLTSLETLVLEKQPEGWRIRHIHWSSRKNTS